MGIRKRQTMNEEFWHGTSGEESAKSKRNQGNYQENNFHKKRPRIQRNSATQSNNEHSFGRGNYNNSERNFRTNRPYNSERSSYGNGDFGSERRNNNSYANRQDNKRFGGQARSRQGGYQSHDNYRTLNDGLSFGDKPQRRYNNNGGGEYRHNRSNDERASFQRRNGNYNPTRSNIQGYTEYKPKDIDLTKPVRLNKFLANAGICSRREADEYIQAGVITVNGVVVTEMGTKVFPTDKVMFHDQTIRTEKKVYLLLNKPKNCVTTTEDTHDRMTVLDLVKNACAERIYPVGRLDRNTTGVLLLTNDGDLASKLTHPKFEKKKIYHATLDKALDIEAYQTIMGGIELDGEVIRPDALEFTVENDRAQIGIEIHSGQNRVVRRIFEKVGYKVIKLDRVFFAGLTKKNLPRGKYRFLTPREVNVLLMGAFE